MVTATGWTMNYILWGISWANLQMMLADAPRYVTRKDKKELKTVDDLKNFLKIQ